MSDDEVMRVLMDAIARLVRMGILDPPGPGPIVPWLNDAAEKARQEEILRQERQYLDNIFEAIGRPMLVERKAQQPGKTALNYIRAMDTNLTRYIAPKFVYPPGTDRVMTTEVCYTDPQECKLVAMNFQLNYHEAEELQRHYDNHMIAVTTPNRSCPISASRMGYMGSMRYRCNNSRQYDKYGGDI